MSFGYTTLIEMRLAEQLRPTLPRIYVVVYVLIAGVLIGAQMFWPPPVGLADNGDFSKIAGYYDLGAWNGSRDEYKAFVSHYVFSPQYHWASKIFSSEHVFVWPAVRIGRALISRDHFDIRILASIHLLALLLAFAGAGLIFSTLTRTRAACLALFTMFVFTDVAYASSLNSFYADTATMLFALTTIAATIACATTVDHRWSWMICLVISGILLITSKMQHAVLGLPLCLFAIVNGIQSAKSVRAAWIVVSVTWLFTMFFMMRSSDPLYKVPPLFTTIFYKIGRSSADPASDFRELGLGPGYVPLKGLFAYAAGSPINDPAWRQIFLRKTGFGKVCLFYLRHPRRAVALIWQDIKEFGPLNPDPGLLHDRSRFNAWHTWRDYIFREYPAHIVLVFAISLCFCVACCVSAALRERYPAWLCFLAVVLMALLALAVATLADAAETARHLFIFHVLTDIVLCFWMWALVDFVVRLITPAQAVKLPPVQDADLMQRIG